MIKVRETRGVRIDESTGKKLVDASLYADTKTEVTDNIDGSDIEGMEDNADLDVGSFVMTADFQAAQLNSSHEWVWG